MTQSPFKVTDQSSWDALLNHAWQFLEDLLASSAISSLTGLAGTVASFFESIIFIISFLLYSSKTQKNIADQSYQYVGTINFRKMRIAKALWTLQKRLNFLWSRLFAKLKLDFWNIKTTTSLHYLISQNLFHKYYIVLYNNINILYAKFFVKSSLFSCPFPNLFMCRCSSMSSNSMFIC